PWGGWRAGAFSARRAETLRAAARPLPGHFLAHHRRHFRAEQLDGPHHLVVRHGADGDLQRAAAVAETLLLVPDPVDNLLRAADEVGAPQRARRLELLPGQGRPASLPADAVHLVLERRVGDVHGLLGRVGDEAVGVDAQRRPGVARLLRRPAV